MKKFEMLRINDSLVKAMNYKNHEFAYVVFKNKQLVENFLHELEFINETSPKHNEYESKRVVLCKKYCKKDASGMDVVINSRYEIADKEAFQNELKTLQSEYSYEIGIRTEQEKRFNDILQEEIPVPEFLKVKKSDLPTEIQTAAELYEYGFMIE